MRKLNSAKCKHHWVLDSQNRGYCSECHAIYENWKDLEKYEKVVGVCIIDPEIMMADIPGYPKRWGVAFQW